MTDRTPQRENTTPTTEIVDQASAYLASDLYPNLITIELDTQVRTYLALRRAPEARALAMEVIRHAEAQGWHLSVDPDGSWRAHAPQPAPVVTIYREPDGVTWHLIGAEAFTLLRGAGDVETLLAEVARISIAHPGLIIRYDDQDSLTLRVQRRRDATREVARLSAQMVARARGDSAALPCDADAVADETWERGEH